MWRGSGAGLVLGLVLGCLLIWSWVINDIPRAALNPAGAGLGWAGLGWDGPGDVIMLRSSINKSLRLETLPRSAARLQAVTAAHWD